MLHRHLFKEIPITFLALWRILFGAILFFECCGANWVGWTKKVFVDPPVLTFNFIGLEWLQPLPGYGMYILFYGMGVLGLCIMLGFRYRLAMVLFTIGWMSVYFMHKTNYNNHHYLVLLLCLMMCVSPAHRFLSLDVRRNPGLARSHIWALFKWQFVILLFIVYTYAAIAKVYPDWINAVLTERWLSYKADMPVLGPLYSWEYSKYIVAWGGILFDLLIIPAMCYKPTRNFAFVLGILFHVANSITFQIGTFPYMMIASAVFFYPDETLVRFVRKFKIPHTTPQPPSEFKSRIVHGAFLLFFAIQIILPLRHNIFPGHVVWNEEGHRLSWRMMLRAKSGSISFDILKQDGERVYHNIYADLTSEQYSTMLGSPDMIWQYCQHLKRLYGPDIQIFVDSRLSVNFRKPVAFIDPQYDMAKAEWNPFKHSEWILSEQVGLRLF